LAKHFCSVFAARGGRAGLHFSPQALKFLRSQRWPGNVRQLENFVERLVVLIDGPSIEFEHVEREFVHRPTFTTQSITAGPLPEIAPESVPMSAPPSSNLALDQAVKKAERDALLRALARTGGNRSVAARVLGVSRATLYNKLKELGIDQG
jgi:two-component system response regulator AtoC